MLLLLTLAGGFAAAAYQHSLGVPWSQAAWPGVLVAGVLYGIVAVVRLVLSEPRQARQTAAPHEVGVTAGTGLWAVIVAWMLGRRRR